MKKVKDNIIRFESPWKENQFYNLLPIKTYYKDKKRLAVMLYDMDAIERFAVLTVYLPDAIISKKNCAYVDMNNCSWAKEFFEKSGLAVPTKRKFQSGYCIYPEWEFNMSKLLDLDTFTKYYKKSKCKTRIVM